MTERPILFSAPMVRALLAGTKTVTRRIVKTREPLSMIGPSNSKDDPDSWGWFFDGPDHHGYMVLGRGHDERHDHGMVSIPCPYGVAGDRLWVREAFQMFDPDKDPIEPERLGRRAPHSGCDGDREIRWTAAYRADGELSHPEHGAARWKPSIHMPRWASRIALDVVSVGVERLHAITEEDAQREGVRPFLKVYKCIAADQRIDCDRVDEKPHRTSFVCLWDEINADRALFSSNPFVWRVEFKRTEP